MAIHASTPREKILAIQPETAVKTCSFLQARVMDSRCKPFSAEISMMRFPTC